MKKVLAMILAVAMIASVATVLVGCGETKDDGEKNYIIYSDNAFAPFEYKKGNQFAGIDMEIMKALADKLGLELVIEDMDFDAVVTSVGKNNIDIAASGLTIKESRKQAVNFSDSYFSEAFQVLIVPTSNTEFDSCKTKADIEAILKAK